MTEKYSWTDNPTVSGVAICDTEILNDCLMHLKYENKTKNIPTTNCITEIPQDIKLELNDGVLTLKAGSKVYMPNGFEADGTTPKFDEVVVESDKTVSAASGGDAPCMIFYNNDNKTLYYEAATKVYSGTESTTDGTYYHTNTNIIDRTTSSTTITSVSLPLCLCSRTSSVITSIDQTFNGFGYIGSSFYFLPNVKALLRNGKNPDGTLKNIERVVDKIYMRHVKGSSSDENFYLAIVPVECGNWWAPRVYEQVEEPTVFSYGGALWINPLTNESKYHGASDSDTWIDYPVALVGTFTRTATTGAIKNFNPKLPFRAVDYNEAVVKSEMVEVPVITQTYKNGTSWYRIYSDGWCEQGGKFYISSDQNVTTTFLKPFKDTNYTLTTSQYYTGTTVSGTANAPANWVQSRSNTSFKVYEDVKGCDVYWYACGYIA